jgi:hypothetical protein
MDARSSSSSNPGEAPPGYWEALSPDAVTQRALPPAYAQHPTSVGGGAPPYDVLAGDGGARLPAAHAPMPAPVFREPSDGADDLVSPVMPTPSAPPLQLTIDPLHGGDSNSGSSSGGTGTGAAFPWSGSGSASQEKASLEKAALAASYAAAPPLSLSASSDQTTTAASPPPAPLSPSQLLGTQLVLPTHLHVCEQWYQEKVEGQPRRRTTWLPAPQRHALLRDVAEHGIASLECAQRLYKAVATYQFTPEDCASILSGAGLRQPITARSVALAVETARILAHAIAPLTAPQLAAVLAAMPGTEATYLARFQVLEFYLPALLLGHDATQALAPQLAALLSSSTSSSSEATTTATARQLPSAALTMLTLAVHPKAALIAHRRIMAAFPASSLTPADLARIVHTLPLDVTVTLPTGPVTLRLAMVQACRERPLVPSATLDDVCDLARHLPAHEVVEVVHALEPSLPPITTLAALQPLLRLALDAELNYAASPITPSSSSSSLASTSSSAPLRVFRLLLPARLGTGLRDVAALPPLLSLFRQGPERLQVLHACLHRTVAPTLDESHALLGRFPAGSGEQATALRVIADVLPRPLDPADAAALLGYVPAGLRVAGLEYLAAFLPPLTSVEALERLLMTIPTASGQRLRALHTLHPLLPRLTCAQAATVLGWLDPGPSRLQALSSVLVHRLADATSPAARASLDRLFPAPSDRREATQILQRAGFVDAI